MNEKMSTDHSHRSWWRPRRGALLSLGAAILAGVIVALAATVNPVAVSPGMRYRDEYRRPPVVPYPAENAYTQEREALGRSLFFDPRLSGSGWISCASCHNPGFSWGDGLPRAIGNGMLQLGRRTPTILNVAWAQALFWDGRAETLEQQALGPIAAAGEMNMPLDHMVSRLRGIPGYQSLFEQAYPGEPIGTETVAKAIATFERRIVSTQAPFDRWVAGEAGAISPAAERGFVLFNEKGKCSACHTGWRFTDDSFRDIGVASADIGRARITPFIDVSHFAFKTPTLRDVARRAPYLHDGSAATLEAIVELYDRGGAVRRPSLADEITPLGLTKAEKSDLVAFLLTLTGADGGTQLPRLPQ